MRTGRSVDVVCASSDEASSGATIFEDFRLGFGVVVPLEDDCSTLDVCLPRVPMVGVVCGIAERLKADL